MNPTINETEHFYIEREDDKLIYYSKENEFAQTFDDGIWTMPILPELDEDIN